MGCFLRCLEGFDMVGDNDLLEADFIEGGCWNLTKRHNVVCKGETTLHVSVSVVYFPSLGHKVQFFD